MAGTISMSENKNVSEMHGCIVCAKIFNILTVYTPQGRLVDYRVTRPGGRALPGESRPWVASATHTAAESVSPFARYNHSIPHLSSGGSSHGFRTCADRM